MSRQFNLIYCLPLVSLLAPAADAAGRASAFRSLKAACKAYIVVRINQGNAATVTLTPLQGQDVSGTGSKAVNALPIWLNNSTATSDAYVQQPAAASFTTDATIAEKIVIFEVLPEAAMDMVNGFRSISVTTGASNAANITSAELLIETDMPGNLPPSSYVN